MLERVNTMVSATSAATAGVPTNINNTRTTRVTPARTLWLTVKRVTLDQGGAVVERVDVDALGEHRPVDLFDRVPDRGEHRREGLSPSHEDDSLDGRVPAVPVVDARRRPRVELDIETTTKWLWRHRPAGADRLAAALELRPRDRR